MTYIIKFAYNCNATKPFSKKIKIKILNKKCFYMFCNHELHFERDYRPDRPFITSSTNS